MNLTKTVTQIVKIFHDNKLFENGVELIGSWCFVLYQKKLGVEPYPFVTQDIDFLISNPYKGKVKVDIVDQLEKLGFKYSFNSDGSIFLWSADFKIEFLTPEKGRGVDEAISVKKLGIKATPIRFVDLLLFEPIQIKEGGIKITTPNPSCYCLHKLIVSERRKSDKWYKDLEQALLTYPITDKKYFLKVYNDLPKPWQKRIHKALERANKEMPLHRKIAQNIADTLHIINN